MTLSQAFERHVPAVDALLRDILAAPSAGFKSLYGMLQYHHGWLDQDLRPVQADSGKRVRPLLCLLSCEACGGEAETALPVAAAIELLHSFSLVHDDIQDNSPLRRHRPTVWALWGAPQAINVGDLLFAEANHCLLRVREVTPAEVALTVASEFQTTCVRLCEGQYLDMDFEQRRLVSSDEYFAMIERKSAALIGFAAWAGAVVAGAGAARADHLRDFGRDLGLAFQIQDDVLGIWGEEAETGKSVSSDIAAAKKTLPWLLALESLPFGDGSELVELYRQRERSEPMVARARDLIERSGARERCQALADERYRSALAALQAADPAPGSAKTLRELVQYLGGRRS